ncbi:hypothetical protein [Lampropedia puyangensis]|nr:hypothetical protein [Lampropedia puyangensis]
MHQYDGYGAMPNDEDKQVCSAASDAAPAQLRHITRAAAVYLGATPR